MGVSAVMTYRSLETHTAKADPARAVWKCPDAVSQVRFGWSTCPIIVKWAS
jgi:hypothetical protein